MNKELFVGLAEVTAARRYLSVAYRAIHQSGDLRLSRCVTLESVRIDRRGSTIGLLMASSVAAQSIVGIDQSLTARQFVLVVVAVVMAFWAAKLALLPVDQKKFEQCANLTGGGLALVRIARSRSE